MLKKSITYNDLDGNQITEDFYFNLTIAECTKLEVGAEGGSLSDKLTDVIKAGNGKEILDAFESIVSKAYGVRSEDGKRFIKKPELWEEFTQTEAWSVLFMEIATDAQKSAEFFRGLVPADIAEKMPVQGGESPKLAIVDEANDVVGIMKKHPKDMTKAELLEAMRAKNQPRVLKYTDVMAMSQAEIQAALEAGATIDLA
jgi:hypothetical protein